MGLILGISIITLFEIMWLSIKVLCNSFKVKNALRRVHDLIGHVLCLESNKVRTILKSASPWFKVLFLVLFGISAIIGFSKGIFIIIIEYYIETSEKVVSHTFFYRNIHSIIVIPLYFTLQYFNVLGM